MAMDTLFKDLIYAARGLRKNLGFTVVATVTIALGIGACTAIFSVVNAVLLRPLPYANAQRLVLLWGELRARNVKDWPFAPPDFRDLRQQSTAIFEDIAGLIPAGRAPIAEAGGEPEQIRVGGGTPNLFRVLGARIASAAISPKTMRRRRCRSQAGQPAAAAAPGHRDHQPRVLDPPLRRRPGGHRQGRRSRRRPRADRRRARAGLRNPLSASRQRRAHAGDVDGGADQLRDGQPQQRRLSRHRPAEAGRECRAGTAPGRPRRRRPPPAFPDQADRRAVLPRDPDVRRPGRRRPAGDSVADGRGRFRAADRMRQRRQPAGRARLRAQPRARRPRRDRRQPRTARAPDAGREPGDRRTRHRAWAAARALRYPVAARARTQGSAAARRCRDGSRGPDLCGDRRRGDRDGLRHHPGAARLAHRRDGGPALGRRPLRRTARRPQAAKRRRGHRGRPVVHSARSAPG